MGEDGSHAVSVGLRAGSDKEVAVDVAVVLVRVEAGQDGDVEGPDGDEVPPAAPDVEATGKVEEAGGEPEGVRGRVEVVGQEEATHPEPPVQPEMCFWRVGFPTARGLGLGFSTV